MTRKRIDLAWSLLSLAVVEILNPLLLIGAALFVSVGLHPVSVDAGQHRYMAALLVFSIALPLVPLIIRARRLWRRRQEEAARFSWRCLLPILPVLVLLPPAMANLLAPSIYTIAHMDLHFRLSCKYFAELLLLKASSCRETRQTNIGFTISS